MCTAPVPRVIPAAPGLGAVDLSRGRVGLSVPSRGSMGRPAGWAASSGVSWVTRTFLNCKWLRLSSAMCKFVLLPGGEPEYPLGRC